MRLIDADALYQKAMDIIHDKKDMKALGIANAIAIAPTIAAEPVRHGEWKPIKPYGFESESDVYECICSECGSNGVPDYKYCPGCGAKMESQDAIEYCMSPFDVTYDVWKEIKKLVEEGSIDVKRKSVKGEENE